MFKRTLSASVLAGLLVLVVAVIVGAYAISSSQLTEREAVRIATTAGLEEVSVGDTVPSIFFSPCSKGDFAYREVTGTSTATKQKTSIVVCKGVFRGFTVRYR